MNVAPRPLVRRAVKRLVNVAVLVIAILVTIVLVFALQARARLPDLKAWHRIHWPDEP